MDISLRHSNQKALLKTIKILIQKEITLELRQKTALYSMILYVVSTVYLCYLSFKLKTNDLNPITWNTIFWIITLFSAVNTISKSFTQERQERMLYYYTIANPVSIILSKTIYNALLMIVLTMGGFLFYILVMGNPVQDVWLYLTSVVLGALGFAATLTMVAGIAAKANNSATLMAVLSFPVVIPMLVMVLKISKNAMDGLDRSLSYKEIATMLSVDAIIIVLSVILFPFLWRS